MKALMVEPGKAGPLSIEEIREPAANTGSLLVSALALGICGTDRELAGGLYGSAPAGHKRLVIGHESLGIVEEAPASSPVRAGDLVVPFVRMPDPEPCDCCAAGAWDRCRNEGFTEHGIKSLDGFGRERYRVDADRVVVIERALGLCGVLCEPASVVAKAWTLIEQATRSACWTPERVLVTGAGPVGLLAAMMGRQRGLDVHVFDRAVTGPKPKLVRDLGASYHHGAFDSVPADFDIVVECTAASAIALPSVSKTKPDGVICLVGVAGKRPPETLDVAAINDRLVLGNRIVLGSVNANRGHYEAGHKALAAADRSWLERLITRRIPFERAGDALTPGDEDVKIVIMFDRARGVVE